MRNIVVKRVYVIKRLAGRDKDSILDFGLRVMNEYPTS